jgi:hypothetical protein
MKCRRQKQRELIANYRIMVGAQFIAPSALVIMSVNFRRTNWALQQPVSAKRSPAPAAG